MHNIVQAGDFSSMWTYTLWKEKYESVPDVLDVGSNTIDAQVYTCR